MKLRISLLIVLNLLMTSEISKVRSGAEINKQTVISNETSLQVKPPDYQGRAEAAVGGGGGGGVQVIHLALIYEVGVT